MPCFAQGLQHDCELKLTRTKEAQVDSSEHVWRVVVLLDQLRHEEPHLSGMSITHGTYIFDCDSGDVPKIPAARRSGYLSHC